MATNLNNTHHIATPCYHFQQLETTEEPDELKGKNAKLTALLGPTRMPTRSGLLKDVLIKRPTIFLFIQPELVIR
jgi:hypothetical protein